MLRCSFFKYPNAFSVIRNFLGLLLVAAVFPVVAQRLPTPKTLTVEDGLCFRDVVSITQDESGLMWFGTRNGLSRYDGYRFVNFGKEAGTKNFFPANRFERNGTCFLNDSTLWTIADFQLFSFNTNNFDIKAIPDIEGRLLQLSPGKENDVWLVSDNSEEQFLWHFTEQNGFEKKHSLPHYRTDFSDINLDTLGHLWWSTTTFGLQKFNSNGELLKRDNNIDYLFFQDDKMTYTDFFIDSQNRFFVYAMKKQAEYELWQYFPESGQKEVLAEGYGNFFFNALEDSQGNIWFGLDNNLFQLQPNGNWVDFSNEIQQVLDFYNITALFEDQTNMLWIGTDGGLLKMPLGKQLFENHLTKKGVGWGNSFRGIGEDLQGNLYFSCNGGDIGFYRKDPKKGIPEKIEIGKEKMVGFEEKDAVEMEKFTTYFVFDHQRNCIWLMFISLLKIDLETWEVEVQPSVNVGFHHGSLNPIALLPDGQIMTGNVLENLTLFNPETGAVKKLWKGISIEKVPILPKVFFAQSNDSLWVGTISKGLYLFNQNGDLLQHYHTASEQRLNNDHVLCLQLDGHKDWLWVGTFGGGVNGIHLPTGEIRAYNQQDGLPDNNVVSILDEGDNLWIGTYNGLSCFNKKAESFQNFYEADGLSHNEFNFSSAFKSRNGQMHFGGMNGINSFYPQDLLNKELNPPIRLTRFTKYDQQQDSLFHYEKTIDLKDPIVISPSVSYFQFEWTLPNYFDSNKNQYFTWMEGLENSWQLLGKSPNIRFNKLPPGEYTLHVKGKDSRGNWSRQPLSLKVLVVPPWWKRWWAYVLFAVSGIGILTFLWQYQLGRLRLQNQLEKQKLEAAQLREIDQAKTRFFTNISHEFRTPLTVILGMTEEISGNSTAKKLIKQSGHNLLRLINQMLDLNKMDAGKLQLKLRSGDLVSYLQYLLESFHSLAAHKNVQLSFASDRASLEMEFDEEKIQHIVSNLLSNAIKFTPGDGRVALTITQSENNTCIQVKDTGVGIPAEQLSLIFERYFQVSGAMSEGEPGSGIGLSFTKELVELMGGNIEVESEVGKGSVFTVLIPVRQSSVRQFDSSAVRQSTRRELDSFKITDKNRVEPTDWRTDELKTAELKKLLLVEDNPEVVTYIQTILQKDYQITVAENGVIGIEKAVELIPDIVISDVMMPVKDGFAVTRFLKNDERTSHIPIILLTAKADAESRLEGLGRGADAYLAKPFDKKELQLRLEKLIELRKKLQARYAQFILPKESALDQGTQIEDAFLLKINGIIEANLDEADFGVTELCREVGMSRSQLFRKLKALTGKSIVAYLRSARLHKARELLQTGEHNISEVAYQVGFNDPKYFSRVFSQEFGHAPKDMN